MMPTNDRLCIACGERKITTRISDCCDTCIARARAATNAPARMTFDDFIVGLAIVGWTPSLDAQYTNARKLWDRLYAAPSAADAREPDDYTLRLLQAAKCPECEGSGTTAYGDECEWCFRRRQALQSLPSPDAGAVQEQGGALDREAIKAWAASPEGQAQKGPTPNAAPINPSICSAHRFRISNCPLCYPKPLPQPNAAPAAAPADEQMHPMGLRTDYGSQQWAMGALSALAQQRARIEALTAELQEALVWKAAYQHDAKTAEAELARQNEANDMLSKERDQANRKAEDWAHECNEAEADAKAAREALTELVAADDARRQCDDGYARRMLNAWAAARTAIGAREKERNADNPRG